MSDAILKPGAGLRVPRGLVALIGLLVAAFLAGSVSALSAALSRLAPASPSLPRAAWLEIPKPVHIFDLAAPALAGLPLVYSARRLSVGSVREDVLAFGTLAGEAPALRLKVSRAAAPRAPAPLFAALAREAADAGLAVDRSGLPDLMATRFGRFEIADVTLMGRGDAASAKAPCSGFRLVLAAPAFSIVGLACGAPSRPIARLDLACLIDRLDLVSAGDDHALIELFASTELKRNPDCAGMRLGPDEVHAAWLDDKPATSRKSLRRR